MNLKLLTQNFLEKSKFKYKKIIKITDYNFEECILINSLSSDYTMILDNLRLIITITGSKGAHLVKVANEKKVTICRVNESFFNRLATEGNFEIDINSLNLS